MCDNFLISVGKVPRGKKMKKCPTCNHKLYGKEGKKRWCNNCGYNNDPEYLKEQNEKQS